MVIEDGEIVSHSQANNGQANNGQANAASTPDIGIASHVAQIVDFVEAIGQDREPSATAQDGRGALEVVLAVYGVFSFFIPKGEQAESYRSQVIDQMAALAAVAAERGLVLAHENEKLIYGDVPQSALVESGFSGYLSLEPHLAAGGTFGGFSGPAGFRRAAKALKDLLAGLGASYG